jgi:predicted SprT family Zn-dependent metalloprotease
MNLTEAKKRFNELAKLHGVADWKFKWINAAHRLGVCHYKKKVFGFSKQYTLNATEKEMDLIFIHEIAHSLTKGHNHDYVWKWKCRELGGDGERCNASAHKYTLREHGWQISCSNNCFTPFIRLKRPPAVNNYLCKKCRQKTIQFKRV